MLDIVEHHFQLVQGLAEDIGVDRPTALEFLLQTLARSTSRPADSSTAPGASPKNAPAPRAWPTVTNSAPPW